MSFSQFLHTSALVHSPNSSVSSSFHIVGSTIENAFILCRPLQWAGKRNACFLWCPCYSEKKRLSCKPRLPSKVGYRYWEFYTQVIVSCIERVLWWEANAVPIAVPSHCCDRSCISYTPLLLLFSAHALVAWAPHSKASL